MKKFELIKPHAQTNEPPEVRSKILSRIQHQLSLKEGEEGMSYLRVDQYDKTSDGYSKGVQPILD